MAPAAGSRNAACHVQQETATASSAGAQCCGRNVTSGPPNQRAYLNRGQFVLAVSCRELAPNAAASDAAPVGRLEARSARPVELVRDCAHVCLDVREQLSHAG